MAQPDFRGARGSNAGDDFHELWAVRQSLALFDSDTELKGMTVEGLRAEDEHGVPSEMWDGVDCALYFNGDTVLSASRIDVIQFKYSSADPAKAWTLSRLTTTSAKTRNNSVLRRLGSAFAAAREKRGGSAVGIRVQLISNQPVDLDVERLFQAIAVPSKPSPTKANLKSVETATNLKGEVLQQFAAALSFPQTGARFVIENSVLSTVASWTESDARTNLNNLLSYIGRMMLPEGKGHWITFETLLAEFGFSAAAALKPCPSQLPKVNHLVPRGVSAQVMDEMRIGKKYICIHGLAGCGKTTALQEIERLLPVGSHMIVFDCYGAGRYLDSDAYRHRPKDAFLQLANELASNLRVPLLLTRSEGVDYPRAFHRRLRQAAEALKAAAPDALLVVVIDAADNSITAARRMVPIERSFVQDVITLGDLPENVRLVLTARSGRVNELQLPHQFGQIQIGGFSRDETAQHVRSVWPAASDPWIDDFYSHSHGNPRVQRYALQQNSENSAAALEILLPGGRMLNDVFQIQLEEARKKAGRKEPVEGFAASLSVLPHPVPSREVAAISGLTEAEVADICVDLSPGIRFMDDGIGFADEDFEAFIRTLNEPQLPAVQARVAERFLQRHETDQYAATHLAAALYSAGRGKDLLSIIEKEVQPKIIRDPILRREVGFHRLQTAMQVSAESSDEASMLRTILVGAEAMHGADTALELIVKNPDLAAMFMGESAVRTLLLDSRQIAHHGRLLFHLMLEEARKGNAIGARSKQRQLAAWLEKRHLELERKEKRRPRSEDWLVTAGDIAAEFETALRVAGPSIAIDVLLRWRPREIAIKAARIVVERLLATGRSDLVQALLADAAVKEPWSLFLLVPLALAGHKIDLKRLERALLRIYHRRWIDLEKTGSPFEETFPSFWLETILTGCEILIAQGNGHKTILPLLGIFADPTHRKIDQLFASKTAVIALQLRATALLAHIAKPSLAIDEFLVTPKDESEEKPDSPRQSNARHREEMRRFVRPLIPLYDTRAQILLSEIPASKRSSVLAATGAPFRDYEYSRIHEAFEMRRKAVIDFALLRSVPDIDTQELLMTCVGLLGGRPGYLGGDELAVLPAFTPYPKSHDTILKTTSTRAAAIIAERTVASEKIDGLLRVCRIVSDISHDEGAALFADAHSMSEEIDVDAIHQLRALAALAIRSATALDQASQRAACQRLHSVTTDAAIRLSNNEGFPWENIVESLVQLDPPFALASISRWQDSDVQDLDTLPLFIRVALQLKLITAESAVALLPLVGRTREPFLGELANACITSNASPQVLAAELFAKDLLLRYGGSRDGDLVNAFKEWSKRRGQAPTPWLQHLMEAADFLAKQEPAKTSAGFDSGHARRIAFEPGQRFASSDEILQAVRAQVGKGNNYVVPSDILEQMPDAVPAADRVAYLNGLAGIRPEDISDYAIAEAIFGAVEHPAWRDLAGIRQWCGTHLPDVIVMRLPGFAHGFGYGGRPPLPPLLRRLAAENVNIPFLLARAIGAHIDDLSSSVVYELARLIVEHSHAGSAATALQSYLERVYRRIPAKDLDEIHPTQVPLALDVGIARFLFALMSDCDVRLRWRAAHCVRRLAALGLTEWFDAWVNLYDNKEETAYRAAGEPFYWLAARLWSVIVFNRVASETPDALVPHTAKLLAIAEDDALPHALIKKFAKDAAMRLLDSGRLKLGAKARKILKAANTSPVPRQKTKTRHDPNSASNKGRAFDFDQLDTVRYWYEYAIDVFADVSLAEFLDAAERWIVDEWKTPPGSSRWDVQPRKYRFSERNWGQSSNDHGREPILEMFTTYLERHAMFCAIGDLMRTRALAAPDADSEDKLESWLRRRGLVYPSYWLADLRSPKPLDRQFWVEPTEIPQWVKTTPDDAFLSEIGWSGEDRETITVHAWHETGSSSYSATVSVHTALVEPETASSLLRALQASRDPYDYRLPEIGDDFEIDAAPYRLRGWLQDFSVDSGMDSLDPFSATVWGITIKPGPAVFVGLSEVVSTEGGAAWIGPNGSVSFRYITWSSKGQDDRTERRRYGLETEGNRLIASTDVLKSYLRETGMDLIVSVKINKEEGDGGYEKAGSEKAKARTAKLLILRKDGGVEDDKGNLGAW
jgi:hypothetical protein